MDWVMTGKSKKWWSEGVRFECQGSGKCCVSHGQYGFVFFTLADRQRAAKFFKISTREFTKKYCDKDQNGHFHLKEETSKTDCLFLKNARCTIYSARPTQCKTWPFWPEVMGPKTWARDVAAFCPGVGKGPVISAEEIQKQLDQN